MRIGFRTVDGVRIRYAESEGPADRTIMLTSPWPESVYAFAPVWSALSAQGSACSPCTSRAPAPSPDS